VEGAWTGEVCGAADLLLADLLTCGPLDALSAGDCDWLRLLIRSGTQQDLLIRSKIPLIRSKIPAVQANPQFRMGLLTGSWTAARYSCIHGRPHPLLANPLAR
jgi:hypothetical protein